MVDDFLLLRYGRRQALIPCIALTVVVGVILPLSPTVHVYIGLKFIQGMVKIGIFVISFIWCMEVSGEEGGETPQIAE